jgi:hypothetical protein
MKSLTRYIEMVLCGLLLTALAHSASFGRTSVGTTPSAGLRADFKRGSKFVLTEKGTFQEVCIYLDSKRGGSGTQALTFALYRDGDGLPAGQVAEIASADFPASQARGLVLLRLGRDPARPRCLLARDSERRRPRHRSLLLRWSRQLVRQRRPLSRGHRRRWVPCRCSSADSSMFVGEPQCIAVKRA